MGKQEKSKENGATTPPQAQATTAPFFGPGSAGPASVAQVTPTAKTQTAPSPGSGAAAPVSVTAGAVSAAATGGGSQQNDGNRREFVESARTYIRSAADFFQMAAVDAGMFDRVLTNWLTIVSNVETTISQIGATGGSQATGDAALLQASRADFATAIRALFTRAAVRLNKPLIRLYLENMYRLPAWAWPASGVFTGINEQQKRAFVRDFGTALQDVTLFAGYAHLNQVTLEEILGRLKTLINDTQILIAGQLANDAGMKATMQQAYSGAVETLLSRASLSMNSSLFQLYMRYRYGGQQLIHEWGDQHVPGITAGIPLGTGGPDPITGNVSFMLSGFRVTILPDGVQSASGGATSANLTFQAPGFHYTGGTVDQVNAIQTPEITIQTSYGPGASPGGTSGYGRGTTPDDQTHGNTTLGFHEGSHGSDYLATINNAMAPVFGGTVGMTIPNYHTAVTAYQAAMASFSATLTRSSELLTDCVGHPTIADYYRAQGNVPPVRCP